MIKYEESAFNKGGHSFPSFLELDVAKDLQNIFDSLKDLDPNKLTNKNHNLQLFENTYSVYSEINKEIYFLLSLKDKSHTYSLLTFSVEEKKIKSHIKLNFVLETYTSGKKESKNIQSKIEDIFIHPKNQNQLCLYNSELLAFIPDLKKQTKVQNNLEDVSQNNLTINIIHQSPSSKYLKFKFSNYDDYFGVLFESSFRFYSINAISSHFEKNFNKETKIVDFSFGPDVEFGWSKLAVFFLEEKGDVYFSCPIFPHNLNISKSFIFDMLAFIQDMQNYESKKLSEEMVCNLKILGEMDKCVGANNITAYLKKLNSEESLGRISAVDKRSKSDLLFVNKEGSKFNQLIVMDIYPLVMIRVADNNYLDIISVFDDISPVRSNSEKNGFILETLKLKSPEENKNLNYKIRCIKSPSNIEKFKITVLFLNDIYEISFPYLQTISKYFQYFTPNDETKINFTEFKSNVENLISFNYSELKKTSPKIVYGYYCLEKINKCYLLVTFLNDKFYVKEICEAVEEEEFEPKLEKEIKFSNLEANLKKYYLNSMFEKSLSDINFENLEILANTALKRITEEENAIKKQVQESPVIGKEIVLDEESLSKFTINYLDEYIQIQIEGLYSHYDTILSSWSNKIQEKVKTITQINTTLKGIDYAKIKDEFIADKTKIDKLKTAVLDKKKKIESKINSIGEKFNKLKRKDVEDKFKVKGYLEDKKKKVESLKKTSGDLKSEFYKCLSEDNFCVVAENLTKDLIQNELLKKATHFERNLKILKSKVLNAVKKQGDLRKNFDERKDEFNYN